MNGFFQAVAGVLIAVVLTMTLRRQGQDIPLLLSVAVCCLVLTVVGRYLEPVVDLIQTLKTVGNLDNDLLQIMLKAVGIGLVAEIAGLICADSGNSALGKSIQILASAVVLWLSVPLMTALLELVQKILGEV